MLSGDRSDTCATVAEQTGMDSWLGRTNTGIQTGLDQEQSSGKKLTMVGDGINDSPAPTAAHTGVSLSDASAAAIHSAQVVLLDGDLSKLVMSHKLSRMTLQTIKQNLFWAFFYNVLAIPVAAGFPESDDRGTQYGIFRCHCDRQQPAAENQKRSDEAASTDQSISILPGMQIRCSGTYRCDPLQRPDSALQRSVYLKRSSSFPV